MKLTVVALTGLVALVASQDSTSTSSSLTPQQSCATKCDPTDVCCNAACYQVPCPDNTAANETTACAAACPQGDGTADETAAYASCQQACFSSLFFTGTAMAKSTGTASGSQFVGEVSATASDASATATHASHTGTGIVDSKTNNAQRTGSSEDAGSSPTSTGSTTTESGSASQIGVQFGVAGILGAVMAAFFL